MLPSRSLQTTIENVYPLRCAVRRVHPPRLRALDGALRDVASVSRTPQERRAPISRMLGLSAIGLAGSAFCEAFLFERLGRLRCVPRSSVTEDGRGESLSESGPRSPSSPSTVGPEARASVESCGPC